MTAYPGKLAGAAFLADPGVQRIFALLGAAGHEARVVGGAVRNALMGLPLSKKQLNIQKFEPMEVGVLPHEVTDIDICTTAPPDAVIRLGRAAGIHAVPTGFEHGTVTLVINRAPFEVTTLREDIETDGRRATVRFGTSFEQDALRRDFTMNALSVDAAGTVCDYAGGMADIMARRVRFIGDPNQRIREDYLRILRLFRFSAAYGLGEIDEAGLAAAIRNREGVKQLSRERIGQETMKLLAQPHAAAVVAAMAEHGFLDEVFGGPADVERFTRMCAIEAGLGEAPGAVRRLAAVGLCGQNAPTRLMKKLRLSYVEARNLEDFVRQMSQPEYSVKPARGEGAGPQSPVNVWAQPFLSSASNDAEEIFWQFRALKGRSVFLEMHPEAADFSDLLIFAWSNSRFDTDDPLRREAFIRVQNWLPPDYSITGRDLMAAGMKPGPGMGHKIVDIRAAWIKAGMPAGRNAQLEIMRAHL